MSYEQIKLELVAFVYEEMRQYRNKDIGRVSTVTELAAKFGIGKSSAAKYIQDILSKDEKEYRINAIVRTAPVMISKPRISELRLLTDPNRDFNDYLGDDSELGDLLKDF